MGMKERIKDLCMILTRNGKNVPFIGARTSPYVLRQRKKYLRYLIIQTMPVNFCRMSAASNGVILRHFILSLYISFVCCKCTNTV